MLESSNLLSINSQNITLNHGALPLFTAIEKLEKHFFYPFDNYLVDLLVISRKVDRSEFETGLNISAFIKEAALKLNLSVSELVYAASNSDHKEHVHASYAVAAYLSGKEGIDDTLRFMRWKYFTLFDDSPSLHNLYPQLDPYRIEGYADIFLTNLWGTHLENPKKDTLSIIFGPYTPQELSALPGNAECMTKIGNSICKWLNLPDSKVDLMVGHVDLSTFPIVGSGSSAFARIVFPQAWTWPHRDSEWSLQLKLE